MNRKIILPVIFLLAFVLRFWQLGGNPSSLDWDEASLGYNAYSILKTGKDEYGNKFPLSIRSFGDYKPPLYTYFTVFPVWLFGLNEYSVRFISALFGCLTVVVSYYLVKKLFKKQGYPFYLTFTFLFAVSPWHIQFSRIAFEANLALFFFILGIYLFMKGLENGRYFIFSFISFALSLYAYHSPRLIVPLLIPGLIIIYHKELKYKLFQFITGLVILLVLAFPIVREINSSTGARFGSVSAINPNEKLGASIKAIELDQKRNDPLGKLTHNRRIIYFKEILAGYLDHYNFDFLFLNGDPPGRHHAVGMGMLNFWDLPFIIAGILFLVKTRKENKNISLLFLWFILAPIASAFTTGTPHAVRALFYLPTYQIITAFGLFYLIAGRKRIVACLIFGLLILNFTYYLHMYYIHTPIEYAGWWQYGYKEAVQEVTEIEKNYDKIIVTYRYDQPYVYFLFYKKTDPQWYQANSGNGEIKRAERNFGKYEFRNINWINDINLRNTLFVSTPSEIPDNTPGIIKNIRFPDGSIAFRIVAR